MNPGCLNNMLTGLYVGGIIMKSVWLVVLFALAAINSVRMIYKPDFLCTFACKLIFLVRHDIKEDFYFEL